MKAVDFEYESVDRIYGEYYEIFKRSPIPGKNAFQAIRELKRLIRENENE